MLVNTKQEITKTLSKLQQPVCRGSDKNALSQTLWQLTGTLPLSNLEGWERFFRREYGKPRFPQIINSVDSAAQMANIPYLDLLSGNGYLRQHAIESLTEPAPNAFFFALLLRRLNDWVPQVQIAATNKIAEIAQLSDKRDVVTALSYTLIHWRSWYRISLPQEAAIDKLIAHYEILALLKDHLIHSPTGKLSILLSEIARSALIDKELNEIAIQAVQPTLRAKVYRFLFDQQVSWTVGHQWSWTDLAYCEGYKMPVTKTRPINSPLDFAANFKKAAQDRSAFVRRVAAEYLVKSHNALGSKAIKYAKQFANDKSEMVAIHGRYALKSLTF